MAVNFIANALGGTATTTTFSITLPATQAGDVLILEYTHRATTDATLGGTSITTGGLTWTQVRNQLHNTSAWSSHTVWTRASGNHSGQTITGAALTNSCAAVVTQYRGALASGDPLTGATIVGEQNASGDVTLAQITTTEADCWVVLVVGNSPDVAVTAQTCTSPGSLTIRAEILSTGGTDSSICHASAAKAAAGATGSFTYSQAAQPSGAWAYAIRAEPAAVVALPALVMAPMRPAPRQV